MHSPKSNQGSETGNAYTRAHIAFAGVALTLDSSGAAFVEQQNTLIVSDLHLEKGSRAAARGRPLPALDSLDTLARLRGVVEAYRPACVVCLGDSFDDVAAGDRMAGADREALHEVCGLVQNWVWISGNHDPQTPAFCDGLRMREMIVGGIVLRHQPEAGCEMPQLVGHFHPKAIISTGSYRFSGPCFCIWERLLIMPAFGAYAGGLPCTHPAISGLQASSPQTYMLHRGKVWPIKTP